MKLLLAIVLGLAAPAGAQELQGALAAAPIGATGGGYRIEGAGVVQHGAASFPEASGEPRQGETEVQYVGGPETQAGDPDAPEEPPVKRPATPAGTFRSQFSLEAPREEPESPIVEQARAFMARPPLNPNNGTHDWTGWCLGFVNTTLRAARGKGDADMARPAAKNAYYAMQAAGRISRDFTRVPAGAALLWTGCSQWGHAAIATGETAADGTPIMITTSHRGIREMSTKQFGCGLPTGWGKI